MWKVFPWHDVTTCPHIVGNSRGSLHKQSRVIDESGKCRVFFNTFIFFTSKLRRTRILSEKHNTHIRTQTDAGNDNTRRQKLASGKNNNVAEHLYYFSITDFQCVMNLLWPSDALWRHRSGSALAQVMACCLTAPNRYLNHCWLISTVSDVHVGAISQDVHQQLFTKMKCTYLEWYQNLSGANESNRQEWNRLQCFLSLASLPPCDQI